MKKLILLTVLALTSTTSFAWSECQIGEVRAFSSTVTPDQSIWMKADGKLLNVKDYIYLNNFVGTMYGGDDEQQFALPKIDDLSLNGKKYPYYICVNGVTLGYAESITSYITQFPDNSSYDQITENRKFASLKQSLMLPAMQYQAYTSLMPQELIPNYYMAQVPEVILPEVVKTGPAKLRNYISLNGLYPATDVLYDCQKGGVYFTFSNRPVDANANYREIISEKPFAKVLNYGGGEMNIQPRIMECLN